MEKTIKSRLGYLAAPIGTAMFADRLYSSVANANVRTNVYGLICSTKELQVWILSFLHLSKLIMGEKNAEPNKMPILGAGIKKRGNPKVPPNPIISLTMQM